MFLGRLLAPRAPFPGQYRKASSTAPRAQWAKGLRFTLSLRAQLFQDFAFAMASVTTTLLAQTRGVMSYPQMATVIPALWFLRQRPKALARLLVCSYLLLSCPFNFPYFLRFQLLVMHLKSDVSYMLASFSNCFLVRQFSGYPSVIIMETEGIWKFSIHLASCRWVYSAKNNSRTLVREESTLVGSRVSDRFQTSLQNYSKQMQYWHK